MGADAKEGGANAKAGGANRPCTVVREMRLGNATVKFCDDAYRSRTAEEWREIWDAVCLAAAGTGASSSGSQSPPKE